MVSGIPRSAYYLDITLSRQYFLISYHSLSYHTGSIPQKQEAAVAMMTGGQSQGVTRMVQTGASSCVLEGTLDGLTRGKHALFVHELGDISNGCTRCAVLIPQNRSHLFLMLCCFIVRLCQFITLPDYLTMHQSIISPLRRMTYFPET